MTLWPSRGLGCIECFTISNIVNTSVVQSELNIKLVEIRDISKVATLKGHTKSVKSLSFDPKGEFLVSFEPLDCPNSNDLLHDPIIKMAREYAYSPIFS